MSASELERVKGFLVECCWSSTDLTAQTSLLELADEESLSMVALLHALEERFSVSFGEEADGIRTVQDVADFLDGQRVYPRLLRPAAGGPAADPGTLLRLASVREPASADSHEKED